MLFYRPSAVRLASASLFAFLLAGSASADSPRIKDADTIELNGKTYRLDGIDAPESDQACADDKGVTYACGRAAREALRNLIGERAVRCDDIGPDTAYPGRRIGRCYVEGLDLNRWLVSQGWAINFEPYAKGGFKSEEGEARAGRRGMWKGCFVAPRDFRRWNKRTAELLGPACPPDARKALFPDDPEMPPGCETKGHYTIRAWPYRGIFHLPGCRSYRTTKAQRWFCSEEEAWAAGFRKAFTCPSRRQ